MARSFVDIFDDIDKVGKPNFQTTKERVEILQRDQTQHLLDFLKYVFDKNIKFLLPKGRPPFTESAGGQNSKLIYGQIRMINYLTNQYKGNLSNMKREQMFIGMLESVTPAEAELLLQMKDKKMKITGLTAKLVEQAFPGLIDASSTTTKG